MHNLSIISVGNMCFACALIAAYYTAWIIKSSRVCSTSNFLPNHNTTNTQPYPHVKSTINSLQNRVTHITHRTYKNKNYLYKLITINNTEIL